MSENTGRPSATGAGRGAAYARSRRCAGDRSWRSGSHAAEMLPVARLVWLRDPDVGSSALLWHCERSETVVVGSGPRSYLLMLRHGKLFGHPLRREPQLLVQPNRRLNAK